MFLIFFISSLLYLNKKTMIKFICWQKKNFIISTRESEIVRNFDQNEKMIII